MKDLPIFQIPFPNSHNSSMMEVKDFEVEVRDREVSSNGTQDSEVDLLQDTDEDELRKTKSKARWDEEMRMAEVLEKKGRCWATTGIIRNSKTYLSIEETLFMAERGTLLLVNSSGMVLSSGDMDQMLIDQKNGFSSQSFQAYKHLKSLGYIVGHHDVQWTMKNEMQHGSTLTGVGESTDSSGISISALEEGFSVTDGLGDMHINHEAKPTFDVYYPNSKFTTSSPGEPDFVVYLAREGSPPSKAEIEILETRCKGVALMVCLVDLGRVCLFSYAKLELDLSSDMSDLVSEFPPPPSSLMEVNDWEVSSNGTQDSEIDLLQDSDEDELLFMSGSIPRFQPRKVQSKARWDEEMRMAEVLEKKGRCWATTGISRNSKTYLSIEEAMFMAERGALVLVNNNDVVLSIGDMYWMLSERKNWCCVDSFKSYKHLKSLGYIVGRHGVQWTLKNDKQHASTSTFVGDSKDSNGISISVLEEGFSISNGLRDMHINDEAKPTFDVYLPNSKFKKSSPGDPYFLAYLTRDDSPLSKAEMEKLEARCNGVPLMVCHVDPSGRVIWFLDKKVELSELP